MQTAICCIAKCENRYLEEWVDYHLSLGFSHIFIYDNNNPDGEQIIPSVSGNEKVTIIDCRGKKAYQNIAYTEFYKTFGEQYDWIAYIDVDEFITFSEESCLTDINDFLSRFSQDVGIVHLNWMCYGDNDIVDIDEDFSVLPRFTRPLDFDKKIQYDFPENNHVKSIIRGGMDIRDKRITVHSPKDLTCKAVDAKGEECPNDYFAPYDFSVAFIRHYVTKTVYEWLLKISKGNVTANAASALYPIERFFLYNERTPEKENAIRTYFLLKEVIQQEESTDSSIKEEELIKLEKRYEKLNRQYNSILNSRAYKLGKRLLAPIKFFKK